ncbi:MAG: hypothetical protein IKR48_11510 [Kiritimatiellae bacterium]|nr:hypothetical protein [Kiritimatiellia bacterium]
MVGRQSRQSVPSRAMGTLHLPNAAWRQHRQRRGCNPRITDYNLSSRVAATQISKAKDRLHNSPVIERCAAATRLFCMEWRYRGLRFAHPRLFLYRRYAAIAIDSYR